MRPTLALIMPRPTLHLRPKAGGRDEPRAPAASDTAAPEGASAHLQGDAPRLPARAPSADREGSNDVRHAPDPSAERGPEPGRDSRRGRRPRGPYPTGNT